MTSRTGFAPPELIDELRFELDRLLPSQEDRITALLRWFGSGSGKTSGYPTHERVPGTLLLEYRTAELLSAFVESDRASAAGALRLFAGHAFRKRNAQLAGLSEAQIDALKDEAGRSTDRGKSRWAQGLGERVI